MSAKQPLKLYFHGRTPNPWKVVIILEELDVPYKLEPVSDVKGKEFLDINPNGRVPALEDPNTGITTWESGSCIEYLIANYHKDNTLSYTTPPEVFHQNNWKYFQMSGQGPYFGQKAWFSSFHPEKVESAIDRYSDEIIRVLGVLEAHLTKTGNPYLVGEKCSYVDLMFVPWNGLLGMLMGENFEEEFKTKFPMTHEWNSRLNERKGVKAMAKVKADALKQS